MTTREITLPTIHLNGNSRRALLSQYQKVHNPLLKAWDAMTQIQFHPRDYYVQGDTAWDAADKERTEVYTDLRKIIDYFETHVNHIEYGEHNITS